METVKFNGYQSNQSSLGMFTYTYERPNIIQILLKGLPGEGKCRKKNFVRFSRPFTCC
jgi:hypothetical protein